MTGGTSHLVDTRIWLMTALTPPHGRLSLEQWRALGEDVDFRSELVEGVVVVSPSPTNAHQRAILALAESLRPYLPAGFDRVPDIDVVIRARPPASVRRPDLVVTATRIDRPLVADDAVLVVECLSPTHRHTDLAVKRREYAAAGIEHYWVLDLDGDRPRLLPLALTNSEYVGDWVTGVYTADRPFNVTVDIDALRA